MRARDFALPAYRFLRDQAGALANLALPAIGVILVGNLLPGLAGGGYELVIFVSNLVGWVVLAQFARVVIGGLLAGQPPTTAALLRPDGRSWSMLWRGLVAAVIIAIPVGTAAVVAFVFALAHAFGSRGGMDEEWYFLLLIPPGLFVSCWLAARLALVPVTAVASEVASPFGVAWTLGRGHAWLAFKLLLLCVVPFLLLAWFLAAAGTGLYYALGLVAVVVGGITSAVLHLAMVVVSSRALVGLYRALAAPPKPTA
jgi:hypothetical protein